MRLDFQPISSMDDAEEALRIAEIVCLFRGSFSISDLDWDDERLLISFLGRLNDGDLREDYATERATGIQFAKEEFIAELQSRIVEQHKDLGPHSPYTWDFESGALLELKPYKNASFSSISYLWLSIFWLMVSPKDYVVVQKSERESFLRTFRVVFELISCFVMAGRTKGALWYLGDSRHPTALLARLRLITNFCGSGIPRLLSQLQASQAAANDAGVDVLLVEAPQGAIKIDSVAYIVGATTQRQPRQDKIMGVKERDRLLSFFLDVPHLPFYGAMIIPFEKSEAEAEECRNEQCIYIPRETLVEYLGAQPTSHHLRKYLKIPGRLLLKRSHELAQSLRVATNDQDLAISWV